MAAQVKALRGSLKLRRGLLSYEYDLAAETKTEIEKALIPVTNKAKGFATVPKGLSSWFKQSNGSFPSANLGDIRQGIRSSSDPSQPNRKGWVSLARVENQTAAGAIFETAGRKNPGGMQKAPKGTPRTNKNFSHSNNPLAGSQFISALDNASPLKQGNVRGQGSGRRGRYMVGRLIYRAWAEDGGKTYAAVTKAIEGAANKFRARVG